MKPSKNAAADLALLIAAILWGGGFVASKVTLSGWTPFVVLALRFGIAAACFWGVFHRRLAGTPKAVKKKGAVIGGLIAVAFGFQMVGLQSVSSAKVSFLCTTYVALVPFLNHLVFRAPLKFRTVAAGLLALAGIGVISLNETLSIGLGDLLSLFYNVPYGLALVFIGFFSDEETDIIQMTFYQFLTIALCTGGLCLLTGQDFRCKDPAAVFGLAYLVIFSTIAAMLIQNTAQRYTTPSMAALMISLESVFGFLFSVLYFHERLTARLLLGSALCFSAICLSVWNGSPPPGGAGPGRT